MKFTGALFVSAAYLAALACADPIVSITSPLTNTRYKAGTEAIISWINPTVGTISQIVLAKGKSNALQPLRTIATNITATDGKFTWKIPFEIDNADDYAFELGNSPDLAFAGPFTIEGGVGGSPAGTTITGTSNSGSPAAPANGAAIPAAPSSSASGSTSQASPHNASTSAASKQNAGQAIVALGMVAAFASQFF